MSDDTNYRQAVIDAIADTLKYEDYGFLSDELESVINNVPAADVVEVVRCKDCAKQRVCRFSQYQGDDGFCKLAERRTDG